METLISYLPWAQITLAIILTIIILIQQRGASIGGVFGGAEGTIHYERRGFEKTLFHATILIAILFVLSAFVQLFIQDSTPSFTQPHNTVNDLTIDDIEITSDSTETTVETQPDFPSLEEFAQ